jgi:threonine dehydrogenase-like Zn-dependent dehydrogenase
MMIAPEKTTGASILSGDGRVTRQQVNVGEARGTQVRVKINVVGICATDLALFHGRYRAPHRSSVCFGHEWAGVVEAVGETVEHIRVGDRVTGECSLWCGTCDGCRRNPNLCHQIEKFGITVDGAARGHILIDAKYLHRGMPDLEPDVLALAEPLAVCHRGLIAAGFRRDPECPPRVLIIGGGMLGQGSALLLSRMFGCSELVLHDLEPSRVDRADALGVRRLEVRLPAAERAAGYAGLYAKGLFDLVIETTGSERALQQGLDLLNPGGALLMLGYLDRAEIAPGDLVLKAGRIVGSIGGSGSFEAIVPWLASHADDARRLITHSFSPDQADEAFAVAGNAHEALKVQLRFS